MSITKKLFPFFKLLRPHQWLKNGFVFVGIFFAHQWQNLVLLKQVGLIAIAFCLLSSSMYIVNDICDVAADKQHPLKKNRPLAAGIIHLLPAIILAIVLAIVGCLLGLLVNKVVLVILFTYVGLNFAYSFWLKKQIILDVFIIAAGFLLRVLSGTIGVGIPPSSWLLLCSFMLTLFLGFCKRRSEQQLFTMQDHYHTATLLHAYKPALLDKLLSITATSALLSYTFYCLQQDTLYYGDDHYFIYTVPLVMYGIFRYLYLLENKTHIGLDIAIDLLKDFQLLVVVLGWILSILILGFLTIS